MPLCGVRADASLSTFRGQPALAQLCVMWVGGYGAIEGGEGRVWC